LIVKQQEVETLKKEQAQLVAINKQMASFKNLSKATFQSLLGYIKDAAVGYLEFDQKARDAAASIGLGSGRMDMMRQNIIQAGVNMAGYGVSVTDAVAAQQAYSEELGRSVILSENALTNMAKVGKATGLGMEAMAGLTSEMEAFGLGAESASNFIYDMYADASKMGLNASKVVKNFKQNLGLLNKLNFKGGAKALAQMAKYSEKFKLDMNSVAAVADKVFRPEGAIEAAAQLQVLGGSLAALGDPFQLMYKARNSPEELAKSLTKAATASAVFNSKTKEWDVNANELDRLKEAATALNMDYTELVKTAKQGAKMNMFENLLSGKNLDSDQRDAISMMTQMVDGKAQIQMGFDGSKAVMKDISALSQTELLSLLEKKKTADEAAANATGMKEQWENLLNQFIVALYPMLEALQKDLKPTLTKLFEWGKDFALTIKEWMTKLANSPIAMFLLKWGLIIGAVGKVLAPFLSIPMWLLKGRMLASGFNSGLAKGPLGPGGKVMSALSGGGKGGAGAAGGFAGAMTKGGKPVAGLNKYAQDVWLQGSAGKAWQAEQQAQTAAMNSQSQSMTKMGSAASVSAGQILAFGAAILMIGGGIWLAADGLSHLAAAFKDLTGPQAFGAVAAIAVVMGGFVLMLYAMVPAITALGIAGGAVALPLLALGAALLMIGGAIALAAWGVSMIVDSFTAMFAVIGENGSGLLMAGLGFLALAGGVGLLTISLLALGAASFLALPGLLVLGLTTSMLTETASALASTGGAEGITKTISAINSVDTGKLEALKELSSWMSLLGATTTIKFEENLHVDGSIDLKGKDGSSMSIDFDKLTNAQKAQLSEIVFNTNKSERSHPGQK